MKKMLYAAMLIAAAGLVPAFATAGGKTSAEVTIGPSPIAGRTRVEGSMMGARNSTDSVQYIGCRTAHEIGYCFAKTRTGRDFMCSNSSAAMLQAMSAVNATSNLRIEADSNGFCRTLEVNNLSSNIIAIASPVASTNPPSTGTVQP